MPKTEVRRSEIVDEGLEPVYPELWLSGAAGAGRALFGAIGRRAAPVVRNSIYPQISGPLKGHPYASRYVGSQKEIADIVRTGYARGIVSKRVPKGDKKYWTETAEDFVPNAPNGVAAIRVPTSRVPANRAVRRKDIEQWDPATNSWRPISEMNRIK